MRVLPCWYVFICVSIPPQIWCHLCCTSITISTFVRISTPEAGLEYENVQRVSRVFEEPDLVHCKGNSQFDELSSKTARFPVAIPTLSGNDN